MIEPSELAIQLADGSVYAAVDVQEVLEALGEMQGADLVRTAHTVGMLNLVSTARAMKAVLEARSLRDDATPLHEKCGAM